MARNNIRSLGVALVLCLGGGVAWLAISGGTPGGGEPKASTHRVVAETTPPGVDLVRPGYETVERKVRPEQTKVRVTPRAVEPERKPFVNSLSMKLVPLPPGRFLMGSPEAEIADLVRQAPDDGVKAMYCGEGPQHPIEIRVPFYMGVHEVTVRQFATFVRESGHQTRSAAADDRDRDWLNPGWKSAQDHDGPVVYVSWDDATAFCEWLSAREKRKYRLPTEAEWEYACRAGTTTRYASGNDEASLRGHANVADQSFNLTREFGPPRRDPFPWNDGFPYTAPVGRFRANAFGLHDMHGNVWEWCRDGYDREYYRLGPAVDPPGPDGAAERVIRGGGWYNQDGLVFRSAYRRHESPGRHFRDIGFRVVCVGSAE